MLFWTVVYFGMMGVHAEEVGNDVIKDDFNLLCNVTKAVTGLWEAALQFDADIDHDKIRELDQTIKEVFFGFKAGGDTGLWALPQNFATKSPDRVKVCGFKEDSSGMPSPSDSMASAFLCLCTPTKERKQLCGFHVEGNGKWSDDSLEDIQKVFAELWGDGFEGIVIKNCVNSGTHVHFEQAKKDLTEKRKALESTLEKRGTLGKIGKDFCNGSNPCANVTKNSTWLEKVKEMENLNLALLQLQERSPTNEQEHSSEPSATPAAESASASQSSHVSVPAAEAENEPIKHQGHLETPKREARKTPKEEPKPEPGEKPKDIPQKQEEANTPPPENETSGSPITSPKWLLLAALLC